MPARSHGRAMAPSLAAPARGWWSPCRQGSPVSRVKQAYRLKQRDGFYVWGPGPPPAAARGRLPPLARARPGLAANASKVAQLAVTDAYWPASQKTGNRQGRPLPRGAAGTHDTLARLLIVGLATGWPPSYAYNLLLLVSSSAFGGQLRDPGKSGRSFLTLPTGVLGLADVERQ